MREALKVRNAEINTASVEIQTLTISGKQVTLAVFRQLREEPLIAPEGTFNGAPWGTVNYHPDKCSDSRPHWHVVWQRGPELLRSLVWESPVFGEFDSEEADEFLYQHVRETLACGKGRYFDGGIPLRPHRAGFTWAKGASFPVHFYLEWRPPQRDAIEAWFRWREASEELDKHLATRAEEGADSLAEFFANREASAKRRLGEAVAETEGAPPTPEEVDQAYRAYRASIEREEQRRKRWRESTDSIAGLPQLFIAV